MIWANVTKFGQNSIAPIFLAGTFMIEGTMHNNCKEISAECNITKALHETGSMKSKGNNNNITSFASYHCKKSKNVLILSTLHPDVPIHTEENSKKKLKLFFL